MEKGNLQAVKWMFQKTDKNTMLGIIDDKMEVKSRNFWQFYLSK